MAKTTAAPSAVGVVLGGDNRVRVLNTTVPPAGWVGQIESSWPDGSTTLGTGTLLDDHVVLTCAHNFYNTKKKIYASAAVFKPGLNRSAIGTLQQPYGAYALQSWSVPILYVKTGGPPPPPAGVAWSDVTNYLYDYAVGKLGKAISDPPGSSMLDVNWPGDAAIPGLACAINGYSGDLDPTASTQYTRPGNVALSNGDDFLMYTMSTYHGDSGAPIYYQPAGKNYWYIIGVHVTGVPDSYPGANDGRNFGPAMTGDALQWVQNVRYGVTQLKAIQPR